MINDKAIKDFQEIFNRKFDKEFSWNPAVESQRQKSCSSRQKPRGSSQLVSFRCAELPLFHDERTSPERVKSAVQNHPSIHLFRVWKRFVMYHLLHAEDKCGCL